MKRSSLILLLFTLSGCGSSMRDETGSFNTPKAIMTITDSTLVHILDAFNRHDLDAIMGYFAEDCSFDFPRGTEPHGQRFTGKVQVREALAGRFKVIPDVHYGDDMHWISGDGRHGVSTWLLTGTTVNGVPVKVRGCDLWEFEGDKVTRKDSYWKIVEPAGKG